MKVPFYYPQESLMQEVLNLLCRRPSASGDPNDPWFLKEKVGRPIVRHEEYHVDYRQIEPEEGIVTYTEPISVPLSKKRVSTGCSFCRMNGERTAFYTNHELRDKEGRIVCPILYNYVCPYCKATGAQAHTYSYCPLKNGEHKSQNSVSPFGVLIKATPRNSTHSRDKSNREKRWNYGFH